MSSIMQGVTRILSLLGDDEVIWYKGDIADLLKKNGFDTYVGLLRP